MKPCIEAFFDPATWTLSYVVYDEPGGSCAIIDPVLDYDPKSIRITNGVACPVGRGVISRLRTCSKSL